MTSSDPWMTEFKEASKLADEIDAMMSATRCLPPSAPEKLHHLLAARRKITTLRSRLQTLQSVLSSLPRWRSITRKVRERKVMLANMTSKVNQTATTLDIIYSHAERESLLGTDTKSGHVRNTTTSLDNQGFVALQQGIIRATFFAAEQDAELDGLGEIIISTKHAMQSINEELHLHTRLVNDLDEGGRVDTTNTQLQVLHRKLETLDEQTKDVSTCLCALVVLIEILVLVVLLVNRKA